MCNPAVAEAAALPPRRTLRRPRRQVTLLGISGELILTAGVIALLFLGWQLWFQSMVTAGVQTRAAAAQSEKWSASKPAAAPPAVPEDPPVMQPVRAAEPFAVIDVPRFGEGWKRVIRETVDTEAVLNSMDAGVGHYAGTQMPGAIGNFAIAAHDTGWGNTFLNLSKLRLGDRIYIQTQDGWYTYRFRNFEYVQPSAVDVLQPVPRDREATPTDRFLTMTTCNPPYHSRERLIAYALFDSWRPLAEGPPTRVS